MGMEEQDRDKEQDRSMEQDRFVQDRVMTQDKASVQDIGGAQDSGKEQDGGAGTKKVYGIRGTNLLSHITRALELETGVFPSPKSSIKYQPSSLLFIDNGRSNSVDRSEEGTCIVLRAACVSSSTSKQRTLVDSSSVILPIELEFRIVGYCG